MGEAKRRGSRDVHIAQSILRTQMEKKKAKDARDARMLLLGIVGAVTP
jgi:hypothetical protein